MSLDNLEFRTLKDEDLQKVTDFVLDHFVAFETLSVTLHIKRDEGKVLFEHHIKNALKQNASIGVFDAKTKELCGLVTCDLGKNEASRLPPDYNTDEQPLHVRQMHKATAGMLDNMADMIGTKDYMFLNMISVRADYGKRGIATEILKSAQNVAKENGCKALSILCTSAYTIKAVTKLGFKPLKEASYAEYVDPITGEKILKDAKEPHVKMATMWKAI